METLVLELKEAIARGALGPYTTKVATLVSHYEELKRRIDTVFGSVPSLMDHSDPGDQQPS